MIKLSDYVIDFLVRKGIRDIFMIVGGGIMHLAESAGNNKNINFFCNYNEQATTYCAEGYARLRNNISACLVTTGPGSTNALSGAASAWVDSVPVIIISGQVKRELIADYSKLRQIGEQEINIIDMARPITKYAVTVNDPNMIRYELERAFFEATTGRPGPVWINIPLDVQAGLLNDKGLASFNAERKTNDRARLRHNVDKAIKLLKNSERPVLLCGYGIRLAKAKNYLNELLDKLRIPVLLSFNGMDLIPEEHPLLIGKPGIIGQRRANFAVQNSDCLLAVGTRLNIKIVGYEYRTFAPHAKKILVDIDPEELVKPTLRPELAIQADAGDFLRELLNRLRDGDIPVSREWRDACGNWKRRYPSITNDFYNDKEHVNTYVFYDRLSEALTAKDTLVTGNGLAALCVYQSFKPKENQRVFTNNGYGAMGWGLPASIGACVAGGGTRTVCVTGDGSIQMNIQELQLINYHNLPIKIFIFNNAGYTSIRLTQDSFFNGHYVGADENSGISNPDFKVLAEAYGLNYEKVRTNDELDDKINNILATDGPFLCELNVSSKQGIIPKTSSRRKEDGSFESMPMEDMFPFLPKEELEENMRISKGVKP